MTNIAQIIEKMADMPENAYVIIDYAYKSPTNPHSHRGYYTEVAIEPMDDYFPITSKEFIEMMQNIIGSTFEGYKGGDFTMTPESEVYCAEYGTCGRYIDDITFDEDTNMVIIHTEDYD